MAPEIQMAQGDQMDDLVPIVQQEDEENGRIIKEKKKKSTDSRSSKRWWLIAAIAFLLTAIIACVMVFVVLPKDKESSAPADTTASTPSNPISVVTNAPSMFIPGSIPTTPPTIFLKYPVPSKDKCDTIRSGNLVEIPKGSTVLSFDVGFDITVDVSTLNDDDDWLGPFMRSVDEFLVPELAGCPTEVASRLLLEDKGKPTMHARGLETSIESIRYAIQNAVTTEHYNGEDACEVDADRPCKHVVVTFALIMEGEERIFVVETLLNLVLAEQQALLYLLGLSDPIKNVVAVRVKSIDITDSPSVAPSGVASTSPTSNPTEFPSSRPTSAPVPGVTPTDRPTPVPTLSPTPGPTSQPTRNPTLNPTPSPTFLPNSSPTSPSPTFLPTLSPTTGSSQSPTTPNFVNMPFPTTNTCPHSFTHSRSYVTTDYESYPKSYSFTHISAKFIPDSWTKSVTKSVTNYAISDYKTEFR
jgi:hypothetical protein